MRILTKTDEQLWNDVRLQCQQILTSTDKFVSVPDYPITTEQKDAWIKYRQAIRDINKVYSDPKSIVWPIPPGSF